MEKNHAVFIPFPAQGHIRPMLKLAQLLHFKFGFHITFLNTHQIHQTLFQNHPISSENNKTPIFEFESFPQGADDSTDILSLINSIVNNKLELPLKDLLLSKFASGQRVTCMISDVAMSCFTLRVAQELGIPAFLLETVSACSLLAYFHYRQLLDKGIIPLQDKSCLINGYLEKTIDWIPSLKGICLKDMPTFVRTTDPKDMMLNIAMLNAQRALSCEAILINTFDDLEQDVLKELFTISPNIYPIGPLHLLANSNTSEKDTINVGLTDLSSEKDEEDIMQWLNSQEPNAVLYVSFGSLVVMSLEKLLEFAWGLANSHAKFLWIIRSDLVIGERDNSLEFELFEKEIKGRGFLSKWCDQERVLAHRSFGGFLTHCGWNSTIESISNGVPMICWPFIADEVTNSWYICNCLGIGVKMGEEVKRDEVERVVKELMETQKGEEMRIRAMKWRTLAREVTISPHGSSYVNLNNMVNNVLKIQP